MIVLSSASVVWSPFPSCSASEILWRKTGNWSNVNIRIVWYEAHQLMRWLLAGLHFTYTIGSLRHEDKAWWRPRFAMWILWKFFSSFWLWPHERDTKDKIGKGWNEGGYDLQGVSWVPTGYLKYLLGTTAWTRTSSWCGPVGLLY